MPATTCTCSEPRIEGAVSSSGGVELDHPLGPLYMAVNPPITFPTPEGATPANLKVALSPGAADKRLSIEILGGRALPPGISAEIDIVVDRERHRVILEREPGEASDVHVAEVVVASLVVPVAARPRLTINIVLEDDGTAELPQLALLLVLLRVTLID